MAERSEDQRRRGDRGTGGHTEVNNGERRSERVGAIWSGFIIEKGSGGEHFDHISSFYEGWVTLGGILGHFPDLKWIRADKAFYPGIGNGNDEAVFNLNHKCLQWLKVNLNRF